MLLVKETTTPISVMRSFALSTPIPDHVGTGAKEMV